MDITRVKRAADRLVGFDRARRRDEAGVLLTLIELAEEYRFDDVEMIEALADRQRIVKGTVEEIGVSQYLALEVAGLLGISAHAAAAKVIDAVRLKYRHPSVLAAVVADEIEVHRAVAAAHRCAALDATVAEQVAERWLPRQRRLSYAGAMKLLDRLIIEAEPVAAYERERERRTARGVYVWGFFEGAVNLSAVMGVLDAKYLLATVNRLAEILLPANPELTVAELRSKALGILAHPAMALALLQRASGQAPLVEVTSTLGGETASELLAGIAGVDVSTSSTPFDKLREPGCELREPGAEVSEADLRLAAPCIGLAVHISGDSLGALDPAARVEAAGHITTRLLAELLGEGINGSGTRITVQPVLDPVAMAPEDRHDPTPRMRRALQVTFPVEPFPFSNRDSAGLDVDHNVAYIDGRRGQTRLGNLAPFGRTLHRAKSADLWQVTQRWEPTNGGSWEVRWTSPLGYRYRVTREGTSRDGPPDGLSPPGAARGT
ncbi:hypothetical protein [Tessaracoccus lacteus]|uniref:DUF222 domain-containing protein n=1 Tax=Tessaracoccus lacteus TaxID=3041766 RepID=A0ABY8PUT5_9ACTN|nr:hypothetical protein [Tessaracoccus sp. T21]WGT46210.1 hypothetical protein QH948_08530 [Tessaracoccus sp. T21]